MTPTDIITYRLFNQHISQTTFTQPHEIVTYLGAMQAQEYAMTKWAIGLRLPGISEEVVEKAFNEGATLRTHLLRPTWHFVSPDDIRWMLALTGPRVQAINMTMYRKMEIDIVLYTRVKDILIKVLQGGKQLTRLELQKRLAQEKIYADGLRLSYLMMWAELDAVICSGARKGNQFTYALLEERASIAKIRTREESLATLFKRFFTSRGPATLHDFVYWSGLTMQDARTGFEMHKENFEQIVINGETYIYSPTFINPSGNFQKTFLMPDYDEYGMSYKKRNFYFEIENKSPEPTATAYNRMIVVNGLIKGSWKRTFQKDVVKVDLHLHAPLSNSDYQDVLQAVEKYGAFLGKKVQVEPEAHSLS